MLIIRLFCLVVSSVAGVTGAWGQEEPLPVSSGGVVTWRVVAELPAVEGQAAPGLAGVFAGALDATRALVAGGTFYGGKGPLEGGRRTFSDRVMVLEQAPGEAGGAPSYTWLPLDERLPQPLAYGASVTLDDGVLLMGGSDGEVCVSDVRLASWDEEAGRLEWTEFPRLPKPLAFAGAGRVGTWVIVVGGASAPEGAGGSAVFGLDLAGRGQDEAFAWQELPVLPAAVQLPIVVGEGGAGGRRLHVFGGRDLRPGGGVVAEGWSLEPATGVWTASGPIRPDAGAAAIPLMAGTAVALEERRLLVLGGDEGRLAQLMEANSQRTGTDEERQAYAQLNAALLAAHPGHRRGQLLYDARLGEWRTAGSFPAATPAVTPAFLWDGAVVLMGGEPAPGRRSAAVWLGALVAD